VGKYFHPVIATLFLLALSALANASNPEDLGHELGSFRNTMYWVAQESEYGSQPATDPVLDLEGNVLARVSSGFKKSLLLEGTGKLLDGRVLNYAGKKDGSSRFHFTVHPWGRGVGDCALVPFHTVAVDPARIPLGSTVEIAETRGMKFPDGTLHDGLWRAEDIGGAIVGDRIDLFIADKSHRKVLADAGITHLKALTVSLISPTPVDSCHDKTPR
jgi:3D (Asp-Asp-Asp) domain-containing protein